MICDDMQSDMLTIHLAREECPQLIEQHTCISSNVEAIIDMTVQAMHHIYPSNSTRSKTSNMHTRT